MIDDVSMEEDLSEKGQSKKSESKFETTDLQQVFHIKNMFQDWFLDYASYVNLDRAIPDINDGMKPVQRRIMHSMWEMDDGRYNKVANIVGNTMKYHPHGDASIYDALVNLGQKELLIDCQGNWGNILTGDSAAAGRYIEARLSKFALDVVFNPKITDWKLSYDGRNKEPVSLPIKFPLLLAQGTLGLGVGLSSLILPHNFNELIDASIDILQGKDFTIYPDFPTGGYIDVRDYNDGAKSEKNKSRIRIRAKINQLDKKTLVITEIPYTTTTQSLIDNISEVVDKGRLKIAKIFDKTSEHAEIILQLAANTSPDQTIDALYAFTSCQLSLSPITCVVMGNEVKFTDVKSILRFSTERTLDLLKKELKFILGELMEKWHWLSLEKIFFEKRIYKELEKDQHSFEEQIEDIERDFDIYRPLFKRDITHEDILKLIDKPVRKISKFDIKEAERQISDIEFDIDEIQNNIEHIVDYAIQWFKQIKKKYGEGKERKTEIRNFDNINAANVAVANHKLYMNCKEGFIGTNLKKDDNVVQIGECSDVDEIITFHKDGTFVVNKIAEKVFVGTEILMSHVFTRNDERTIYNMVYQDGTSGSTFVKRFAIGGVSRDKTYDLTQGKEGSKILYFTKNPNGEAEKVRITLKHKPKLKKAVFDFDFSTLAIKGRGSRGNILSKHPVRKVEILAKGTSTLSAMSIWFDESVKRLNTEERGLPLGSFEADDKIIAYYKSGYYKLSGFDLTTHFDDGLLYMEKLNPRKPITVIYFDKQHKKYYLRRSLPEVSDKKTDLLSGNRKAEMIFCTSNYLPQIEVTYIDKKKEKSTEVILAADVSNIIKLKAKGKKMAYEEIKSIRELEPLAYEEPEKNDENENAKETGENTEGFAKMDEIINQVSDFKTSNPEDGDGIQMNLFD